MSKYDRMTDEQLLCDYKNGNQEIMDYLMVKYKSMVRKKARAMYLLGGENEDLIQEGMIGLIKAVRDFDVTQKTSFSSLQNFVFPGRCTQRLRRQTEKSICL